MQSVATRGMSAGEVHTSAGTELKAALRALAECPNDLTANQIGVRFAAVRGRPVIADGRKMSIEKVPDLHKGSASRWRVNDQEQAGAR